MRPKITPDHRNGILFDPGHLRADFVKVGSERDVRAVDRCDFLLRVDASDGRFDIRNCPVRASRLNSMPPIPTNDARSNRCRRPRSGDEIRHDGTLASMCGCPRDEDLLCICRDR
jgi:hypothetical protein